MMKLTRYLFYLAVNELISDNTQNAFYLLAEYFRWVNYILNKLDLII